MIYKGSILTRNKRLFPTLRPSELILLDLLTEPKLRDGIVPAVTPVLMDLTGYKQITVLKAAVNLRRRRLIRTRRVGRNNIYEANMAQVSQLIKKAKNYQKKKWMI